MSTSKTEGKSVWQGHLAQLKLFSTLIENFGIFWLSFPREEVVENSVNFVCPTPTIIHRDLYYVSLVLYVRVMARVVAMNRLIFRWNLQKRIDYLGQPRKSILYHSFNWENINGWWFTPRHWMMRVIGRKRLPIPGKKGENLAYLHVEPYFSIKIAPQRWNCAGKSKIARNECVKKYFISSSRFVRQFFKSHLCVHTVTLILCLFCGEICY